MTNDGRPDIVFYGDVDGIASLDQNEDGSFSPARTIELVEGCERRGSIRVTDLDGNGKQDIVLLGDTMLTLLRNGTKRVELPLGESYRSKVKRFEIVDVNGDERPDNLFFALDPNFGISGSDGRLRSA